MSKGIGIELCKVKSLGRWVAKPHGCTQRFSTAPLHVAVSETVAAAEAP